MAKFTITIGEYGNQPPIQIGITSINIDNKSEYIFNKDDFTIDSFPPYEDPENDDILKIKILSLPAQLNSYLSYNGIPVNINDEILITDIIAGKLIFISDINEDNAYTDTFTYDVADVGSSLFGGLIGEVEIIIEEKTNSPATIGDGEQSIDYAELLIFTRDMFTSQTTPPYNDPDGDVALELKILTLPGDGVIKLSNIPVISNQVIDFTDIDSGKLTYTPSTVDKNGDIENFKFAIADAGSGIFVQ